jgi:hypothetical protein
MLPGMSTSEDSSLTALTTLRAELEAERAARRALEAERTALAERNRRLDHLVRELRQALYGKKSEKLTPDERQLAFEDLEMAVAEVEAIPTRASPRRVIPPFLAGIDRRIYAAAFSFWAGVIPPMQMFGRSLLQAHSHCLAKSWASSVVSMMC